MLLMLEKSIWGRIYHPIYRYAEANNKYMVDYDKNKESSYLQHWNVNNLYGYAMLQKLLVNNFELIKDNSQFNEDFIKEQQWRNWWRIFSWNWCSVFRKIDLPFLLGRMKIEKSKRL